MRVDGANGFPARGSVETHANGVVVNSLIAKHVLARLQQQTAGALALVSGRPIADIDAIFTPLALTAVGGHGAEIRRLVEGKVTHDATAPLPEALRANTTRLYGLTIAPERLHEIRRERRPDSRYADLDNCRYEIEEAEKLMRREGVRSINSTSKSIEEIATTILRELRIQRQVY